MSLWRSLKARDRGALTEGAAVDSRTFASDWPEAVSSDSRQLQIGIPPQVLKGGSHICAPSHCRRCRPARPADRQFDEPYRLVIRERSRDELPPFSCCLEALHSPSISESDSAADAVALAAIRVADGELIIGIGVK
jgi:hypothetical protein